MEPMDNFQLEITAHTKETLYLALNIVFTYKTKVVGYLEAEVNGRKVLQLFDTDYRREGFTNATWFPKPMELSMALPMILAWLKDEEPLERSGQGPDGGESKGFHISASGMSRWGDPICTIYPIWAWHSK